MRAGLTQAQLGRWETGTVAPSLDTLLELLRACGYDMPLMLEPYQPVDDRRLGQLQRLSPERRLQNMLKRQGEGEA
jgi:transcriptional regulator with XRE-family HTH domain